jgi:tetratricopeptide (TPR) repeat protein
VALGEALKLRPGDAAASAALQDAEAGRKKTAASAQAAEAAKKKTEAYQKLIGDGRQALEAKRYDEAIKAFGDAQKLLPGDQTSAGYLKDAQQAKADATAAVAAAAKKQAEEAQKAAVAAAIAKRDNDFRNAMIAGQQAMQAKNYKEAVQSYQFAIRIKPNDAQATAQLDAAQRELRRVETTPKEDPKKKEDVKKKDDTKKKKEEASTPAPTFQELMLAGQKAMQAKKYDEAVKAFSDAQELRPNDAAVAKLLKQAQKLQSDTKTDKKKKSPS